MILMKQRYCSDEPVRRLRRAKSELHQLWALGILCKLQRVTQSFHTTSNLSIVLTKRAGNGDSDGRRRPGWLLVAHTFHSHICSVHRHKKKSHQSKLTLNKTVRHFPQLFTRQIAKTFKRTKKQLRILCTGQAMINILWKRP